MRRERQPNRRRMGILPTMAWWVADAGCELIVSKGIGSGIGRRRRLGVWGGKRALVQLIRFLSLLFSSAHWVSNVAGDEFFASPAAKSSQGHCAALSTPSHRALADGNVSALLQSDRDTLLEWKQHWISYPAQSPNVTEFLRGWSEGDSSPCAWRGISCESVGQEGMRVVGVNMAGLAMKGELPTDGYANLTFCRSLELSGNQINGTIPPAIALMPSLQVLDLCENRIGGGIPPKFQGLVNHLVAMNLSVNGLSDPVGPSLFPSCGALRALNLSYNNIGGELPNLENCTSLQLIDFQSNNFTGSIPPELGSLPLLQTLSLSENPGIGGQIPGELLRNCRSLRSLLLSRMSLNGAMPRDLGRCGDLEVINLQSNFLSGPLLQGLGQLKRLSVLALGNNSFMGPLPSDLSAATALQYLDLSRNRITGTVPSSYGGFSSLLGLALQQNQLEGTFPVVLTALQNLTTLDLSHNRFSGSIPAEIAANRGLTILAAAFNEFDGHIPPDIGALTSLQVLDLSNNGLTGSIPSTLSALKHLLLLQLSNNSLRGSIPPELGNCSSLIWINLCRNRLEGSIPDSFQSIGSSAPQTLETNQRNLALLPFDMGECKALERWLPGTFEPYSFLVIDLAEQGRRCQLWWNLLLKGGLHPAELDSPLAYMQLSFNELTGPIPPQIGLEGKFSILFLDHNQLTGFIPDILDKIPLYSLNISHNRIKGSIPKSLGFARHLLALDLSFCDLTGPLPSSLTLLTFMDRFNVSYNNLSGPVLLTNQFATYGFSVYTGNPNLCYDGTPYGSLAADAKLLRQCGALGPSSSRSHANNWRTSSALDPNEILGISLGCTMFTLFLITLICFGASWAGRRSPNATNALSEYSKSMKGSRDWAMLYSSRDLLKMPVSSFEKDFLPRSLAYLDLLIATNSFDEGNIIGSGGFGIVYKARLVDDSVVAIKKLVQGGADGDREFAAEMLTLGNIRHANLVPFLGYCAFESEKLLVYKYMTNGSLEDWLHDRPRGKEALTWTRRVQIAAGAARGLAFLHHGCAPVIIHRDMKASNILLDDSFFPCVTDFGLARRMYGQDTHVSTVVAGTLGYVPPEYSQTWRSTTKGDVYSFGVVLLELVTGRRPTGPDFLDDDGSGSFLGGNVVEWVRILLAKRREDDTYDPVIKGQADSLDLFQILKVGVKCAEDNPNNRPNMSDVTEALDRIHLSLSKKSPSRALL